MRNPNVNEDELNALLQSGDLDRMEQLLNDLDNDPEGLVISDTPKPVETDIQPATTESEPSVEKVETAGTTPVAETEPTAESSTEPEQPAQTVESVDAKPVVATKDGKHTIPYEVLESVRKQNSVLSDQVLQMQQALQERDRLQQVLDRHGIKLDANHVEDIDPETLQQLQEDFPTVGNAIGKLVARVDALTKVQQPSVTPPQQDPVTQAFQSIPELGQWQTHDRDRMDYAIVVDERLMNDPMWQSKTVTERFAEAVRQTKAAFGEESAVIPEPVKSVAPVTNVPPVPKTPAAAKPQANSLPSSPSEIGSTLRSEPVKGDPNRYTGMSANQLQNEFSQMSTDELDRLLDTLDY